MLEGGRFLGSREGGRLLRQRGAKPAAGSRPFGGAAENRASVSAWGEHRDAPPPGSPRPESSPGRLGLLHRPAARTGPEAPAGTESHFCAAARAPVSLTLEPAGYLSNSRGNSAAAEGKNVTSAAEQGGRRPQPGLCLCRPAPCRRGSRGSGLGLGSTGLALPSPGPGSPTLSEAAVCGGCGGSPLGLLSG